MASLPNGEDLLRLMSALPATALPSSLPSSSTTSPLLAQSQLLLWNAFFSSLQGAAVSLPQSDLEEGEILHPKQSSPPSETKPRRPPVTDESVVRVPLSHGWSRHTFIREMTAFGIKGVVVYFSPCRKRLGSFSEILRYLGKHETGVVNREQFTFSPKVIVGQFFVGVPKNGQLVNVKFTEEDVKTELKRLQEDRARKIGEEKEKREEKRKEILRREREEKQKQRKEEGVEKEKDEKEKDEEKGGEPKRRAVEDLTLEEIRPLPSFQRIHGLQLGGEALGHLLMTVQFMHNFKNSLAFDSTPSLEDLSRGCMGDGSSSLLSTLWTLLSRCLTHLPSSHSHSLHGKTLAEIVPTPTNRDELLRLFLSQTDGDGPELSSALSSSPFLSLSPDHKAAVLGTLVNELVCSSAVRSQLDGHLEEVTRLKGERWMKEGKMRALRHHQQRRRRRNGEEETEIPPPPSPERAIKFTPGIGQCEVLSPEEEALNDEEMDEVLHEMGVRSEDLSSSINALNSRIRCFPIGEDRYHRLYWSLPSHLPTLVESIESGHKHNPACDLSICQTDPHSIHSDTFIDPEVIGCLEDAIDRLMDGGEGKRRKLGLRMMGNPEKRGWWTVTSKDVDQWKANLHQRGLRERVLHRSITRNDLIDDLPLGEITIGPIERRVDGETEEERGREELSKRLIHLESLLKEEGILEGERGEEEGCTVEAIKRKLLAIQQSIRFNLMAEKEEEEEEEEGKEEEGREEGEELLDEWRRMTERASTSSQLGLATQMLCSFLPLPSSWICSLCLFPSPSSSPSLLCPSCSHSRIHPSCLSPPHPFICLPCQPKMALIDEDDDQIPPPSFDGLPSKGAVKRRAEPNSFTVPPSMVNGLGRNILDEMQEVEGCEYFASPVDLDEVPSYSILIDKPMDLGTISQKVDRAGYSDAEDLYADLSLVFSNCRSFNEDDSEIGEAGIRLSRFLAKRWRQLKYNLSKRVKRMKMDS